MSVVGIFHDITLENEDTEKTATFGVSNSRGTQNREIATQRCSKDSF